MTKNDFLPTSLSESISDESCSILAEIGEISIDAVLNDGLLKDIPIVSTTISLFKIGSSIRERHHLTKLIAFIQQMNEGIMNEDQRKKYQEALKDDCQKRNKEIAYLLIIIDRYLHIDQSRYLAKIFSAYLDEKIKWQKVVEYSEIINRLLPSDYNLLKSKSSYHSSKDQNTDTLQRLIALGLIIEDLQPTNYTLQNGELIINANNSREEKKRTYHRTDFGNKLVKILED